MMKYKILETIYDEYYRNDELVTLKKEIVIDELGNKKELIYERIEKEMLACSCNGNYEKTLRTIQAFKLIKESSID